MRDFCLILGTARGGTTSLFEALRNCAGVASSSVKELHFFDRTNKIFTPDTLAEYERGFESDGVCMEATPSYLLLPDIPKRVRIVVPQARFIVLLRDPINRAFSHYALTQRAIPIWGTYLDKFGLTFDHFVEHELNGAGYQDQSEFLNFAYLARGRYVEQLERWFECFPLARFLLLKSEDYYAQPEEIAMRCLKFALGSDSVADMPTPVKTYEFPQAVQDYGVVPTEMRNRLRRYYQPYNVRLAELLGQKFAWD